MISTKFISRTSIFSLIAAAFLGTTAQAETTCYSTNDLLKDGEESGPWCVADVSFEADRSEYISVECQASTKFEGKRDEREFDVDIYVDNKNVSTKPVERPKNGMLQRLRTLAYHKAYVGVGWHNIQCRQTVVSGKCLRTQVCVTH